ncbi:MAG: CBS domain-containing protein [Methylococcaceae bacterium]
MSIGQFCNRDTAIVRREDSIVDVARIMRQWHVGCLVVVENDDRGVKPVGIVTDRDLVIEILAAQLNPDSVTVGDIIGKNLLTAREQDGLWETLRRMQARGVRRIPVVDTDGYLVGIITQDDVLEILVGELADLVKISERGRSEEFRHRGE